MPTTLNTPSVSIDGGPPVRAELTITTEEIDVTLSVETKPDPKWEYTDPAGHFHAWSEGDVLPTLTTRTRRIACGGDCCEGYDETYYVCMICEEEIAPGTITTTPTARQFMPGRKSWTLEVEGHITAERVSVRLVAERRMVFGVAMPVGGEFSPAAGRTRLVGIGPLGFRTVTP